MVYEMRKCMNYLSQTENKHFYFSGKNCLFNTNSEVCIQYVDPNVNYFNGEESSAKCPHILPVLLFPFHLKQMGNIY